MRRQLKDVIFLKLVNKSRLYFHLERLFILKIVKQKQIDVDVEMVKAGFKLALMVLI